MNPLVKLLTLCLFSTASATTTIYNTATIPFQAPLLTQRQTLKIQLDNELQAILISDPNLEQSGAALTVQTGSWDDLDEHPGIAHFLEHMLFLGTKKYPIESEYTKHVQKNGGIFNAFTGPNFTSYLFTVDNRAFPETLDRFSQFFIEPLFNPSGVSRELNAIDQEYAKNFENDSMRLYYVYKDLASRSHPDSRFKIGSSETLAHTTQEILRHWFEENYSANNMRLIVYSPMPLSEIEALVTTDFTPIINRHRVPNSYGSALTDDLENHIVYIQPVKQLRQLTIGWEVPQHLAEDYDAKPDSLICHVLGHEGEESLLASLKREDLAEGVSCGSSRRYNNPMQMQVDVTLTDKGVEQVYTVIDRVHQTIAMMRKNGISQALFDDVKQLKTINYQYPERENLFQTLVSDAVRLSNEPVAGYPQQGDVPTRFDIALTGELLSHLTPANARYFLIAPASQTGVKPTRTEPWLQVQYAVKEIPTDRSRNWGRLSNTNSGIALPPPNPFTPTNLTVVHPIAKDLPLIPTPKTLIDDSYGTLYWAPDQRYGVPKVSWHIVLKTPQVDPGKPTKAVLAELTVKAVKEALNHYSYAAQIAGLKYDIATTDFGITITIEGYSQHAQGLLQEIAKELKNPKPTEEQFKTYKVSLLRDYQNASKELPLKQAMEKTKTLFYQYASSNKQKASAIRRVNYDKFLAYTASLYDQVAINALLYGNTTESEAQKAWYSVREIIGGEGYPKQDQLKQSTIMLSNQEGPFYIESYSKSQGNATLLAIESKEFSLANRAAQQILTQALGSAFYSELRTKQQTGYIVQAWGENLKDNLFTFFGVQSKSHEPKELLARFELFIERYMQELDSELTPDDFNTIKQAIVTQLTTPQKSLNCMGTLLYQLAFEMNANFNYLNERINALNELDYTTFTSWAKENFGRNNKRRLAILIQGENKAQQPPYQRITSADKIRELGKF